MPLPLRSLKPQPRAILRAFGRSCDGLSPVWAWLSRVRRWWFGLLPLPIVTVSPLETFIKMMGSSGSTINPDDSNHMGTEIDSCSSSSSSSSSSNNTAIMKLHIQERKTAAVVGAIATTAAPAVVAAVTVAEAVLVIQ